jgi:hypothetical protein
VSLEPELASLRSWETACGLSLRINSGYKKCKHGLFVYLFIQPVLVFELRSSC